MGPSKNRKISIDIGGHQTSISLEDEFYIEFKRIAYERHLNLSSLIAQIDEHRAHENLSSAVRLFVLEQLKRERYAGEETPVLDGRLVKTLRFR